MNMFELDKAHGGILKINPIDKIGVLTRMGLH